MDQPTAFEEIAGTRLRAPTPRKILTLTVLWLALACGLPLYQLREARRQAHQDLQHFLTADKLDHAGVIAAFDRSNQDLDAVASGPCLILAFTSIFLVNRMLKLKRQYSVLAHEFSASGGCESELRETSEN